MDNKELLIAVAVYGIYLPLGVLLWAGLIALFVTWLKGEL